MFRALMSRVLSPFSSELGNFGLLIKTKEIYEIFNIFVK